MPAWPLFVMLGAGFAYLAGRGALVKAHTKASAAAAGLRPVRDLKHLPAELQKTALWTLSDGGFESRTLFGVVTRNAHDIDVTAFDFETLRERRGEWAWLTVEPPFRIGGTVSVVVCEMDRAFPHVLLKRVGTGDELPHDALIEKAMHVAKAARVALGMPGAYPAELPKTLASRRIDGADAADATAPAGPTLPEGWRAYGDAEALSALVRGGFAATLERSGRRDLVVELLGPLVIVYPAMRDVVGADAVADLTSTAIAITEGALAASPSLSPRGVEAKRPE
ncbi:MAG TPA: hypothetical protein VGM39_15970 [Kofleriaceae bacterium]|jgi:hypothetical protein